MKRLWGKGDERRAKDLTLLFALAAFSNLTSSGGPFEGTTKKELTELKESGVRSMAVAIEGDAAETLALFKEIDRQTQSFLVDPSNLPSMAYLMQFHAAATLMMVPVSARGVAPAKSKKEPGDLIALLIRAAQTGKPPEGFFPQGASALSLVDLMLQIHEIGIRASLEAFRLHVSAGRILD